MSILVQLDSIILPSGMILKEYDKQSMINSTVYQTIGGKQIVYNYVNNTGLVIDLATEDTGWITKQQNDDIRALSNIKDATYTLIYGDRQFIVRFRTEDAPVIDTEPIIARVNQSQNDFYIGIIKFALA